MIHFFECSKGHISEHSISATDNKGKLHLTTKEINESRKTKIQRTIKCKTSKCRRISLEVILSPRQVRAARNFSPSLIYMREDGEVVVPGRNDPSQLPANYLASLHKQGYKEVQINTFREYEKFQKDISQRLKERSDAYNYAEQEAYDYAINQEIESLRRGGRVEIPNENGQGSRFIEMPPLDKLDHPQVRELAEYAISKLKGHKFKSENSNPFIEAFENDNLSYMDQDTNWERRG